MATKKLTAAASNRDDLGSRLVRVELAKRGWSVAALARAIGCDRGGLSVSLCRGVPFLLTRARIEAAFNYTVPIWSAPGALALRKECLDHLGFDPSLVTIVELKKRARALGIECPDSMRRREAIESEILSRLSFLPPSVKS